MASRHLSTPTSSRKVANPFTVRATGVRPSADVSTPAAATSRVRKALYMPAIGPDTTPAPEPAPESEGAPEPESVGIGANLGDNLLFECDFEFSSDKQLDKVVQLMMPAEILSKLLSTSNLPEGLDRMYSRDDALTAVGDSAVEYVNTMLHNAGVKPLVGDAQLDIRRPINEAIIQDTTDLIFEMDARFPS